MGSEETPLLCKEVDEDEEEVCYAMRTSDEGLTEEEAKLRLEEFGLNVLEESKRSEILKLLGFFTGPMPLMIWLATVVVAIEGDWEDFSVLMVLQIVNGVVGYFEEKSAGDAIEELRKSLSPRALVKRSNEFFDIEAKYLVPGDLLSVKLGDVAPADCRLRSGKKKIQVDQAALTGESLPVTRGDGDKLFMGSIIKRGETEAIVVKTGSNTFFGRAARMVKKAAKNQQGRFAKVMFQNTLVLMALSVTLCTVIFFQVYRSGLDFLDALSTVVVILVASTPIAMQIVSTTVMAVGGRRLAEKKAILARLSAIEELAGMDVLCSDKTGTLTQNKLQLFEPVIIDETLTKDELFFLAALAAKRMHEGADAIDTVVADASKDQNFQSYEEIDFMPFDPAFRRTEATLRFNGELFKVTKGATMTILDLCSDKDKVAREVLKANDIFASRGFRSLGVAISRKENWTFCGVLSIFDPPRSDTKETIKRAKAMGITVKMVTGDQKAIALETSKAICLSSHPYIANLKDFLEAEKTKRLENFCEEADGFAEVYPEHKYQIVESLQENHVVGMTGDGVNDAPALKKSNVGIAVEGSTDAARAAADIVLTEPGLSVIIDAILLARCIFARVRNYVIYRIACTLQLLFFFFFACLLFKPRDYFCYTERGSIAHSVFPSCDYNATTTHDYEENGAKYPYYYPSAEYSFSLPVLGIVIITILNDGCMLTIARDHVIPAQFPQKWDLPQLRLVASVLASVPLASSLLLLYLGLSAADGLYPPYAFLFGRQVPEAFQNSSNDRYYLPYPQLLMLIYLKISISDFLTLFSARTQGFFFTRAPSLPLAASFLVATLTATLVARFASIDDSTYPMEPISSTACAFLWAFNLAFFLLQDIAKVITYKLIDLYVRHHPGNNKSTMNDDPPLLLAKQHHHQDDDADFQV